MISKQISDSVFEALFRQAVIDNFDEELDSLPSDAEMAKLYTFSERHEKRMRKLFVHEERKEKVRTALKIGRRIAAAVIIAVSILFGIMMFNPDVRATVTQTIVEWFYEFVRFTSRAPAVDAGSALEPTWIPDGFIEELRDETDMGVILIYLSESGIIVSFMSSVASGLMSVDNEYAIYEVLVIDSTEYHTLTATEPSGENSIIWDLYGWRYILRSTLSVQYLQKIALSLG